ncbi:hypothetical protein C8R45DRAFT_1102458 [Mycena sanguinolenta]|nr:hypothetical protein C8R45DRAFT_1102458 [Mycena sanguinolenta]
MSNLFNGFSATWVFPDHDPCFGDPSNTSSICQIPSDTMIRFLNISSPSAYLDVYCDNPPVDSCAFGYCPNPDVASPVVRYSTYFTSLVSAILILYSPEHVASSFFAQLLNNYSFIVAALVAIAKHNLTKFHSVVALTLAASPLSLYILLYVLRSLLGRQTRLDAVFGSGMYLNRALVLLMMPMWTSLLGFTTLPTSVWQFQQAACDTQIANNHIASLFFLPFIVFFIDSPESGALIMASIVVPWGIAIWRLRKIIWAKRDRVLPLGRLWRKVVNRYPFIQFDSVIVLPHVFWIFNVEVGLRILSTRERFSATYGQLLAIFVTVPPFIQLCLVLLRIPTWFVDLAWVRLLMGRQHRPFAGTRPQDESALSKPMQKDPTMMGLLGDRPNGLPHGSDRIQMRELDLSKGRNPAWRSEPYS